MNKSLAPFFFQLPTLLFCSKRQNFTIPRENISFQTADDVALNILCLLKKKKKKFPMHLPHFSPQISPSLAWCTIITALATAIPKSGTATGNHARQADQPYFSCITFTKLCADVDTKRIGVWGSSYYGGHMLWCLPSPRQNRVLGQVAETMQRPCISFC
jgi:hypothetical protein